MPDAPTGLPKFQLKQIETIAESLIGKSTEQLSNEVRQHVALAEIAKADHQFLNLKLAKRPSCG